MRVFTEQTALLKFVQLSWADRLLVIEASVALIFASLVIAILPFRRIGVFASPHLRGAEPNPDERAQIVQRVRWAVGACASRLPVRAKCFEQGLATQRMLRQRGVDTSLYFGAAPDDQKRIAAHVWVRDGDSDVIGCDIATQFVVMAVFPKRH